VRDIDDFYHIPKNAYKKNQGGSERHFLWHFLLTSELSFVYTDRVQWGGLRDLHECESNAMSRVLSEGNLYYYYGYFGRSVPAAMSL